MNDWFADGATAQCCLTVPTSVATKPTRLSHAEASSVPIGELTAWQGLFDRLKLQPGVEVPLASAPDAYRNALPHRRGLGKMVVSLQT